MHIIQGHLVQRKKPDTSDLHAMMYRYKKDRDNKYCFRQAEMGVGDCAGLRVRLPALQTTHKPYLSVWWNMCTVYPPSIIAIACPRQRLVQSLPLSLASTLSSLSGSVALWYALRLYSEGTFKISRYAQVNLYAFNSSLHVCLGQCHPHQTRLCSCGAS